MAFENPLGTNNLAIFEASTGLRQYQAVAVNSNSLLTSPTTEGEFIGVLVSSGTTNSTVAGRVQSVQVYGVSKILQGSTALSVGDKFSVDSNGLAVAHVEADNVGGYVLSDSDSTGVAGTTDDEFGIISVLLVHMGQGTTTA